METIESTCRQDSSRSRTNFETRMAEQMARLHIGARQGIKRKRIDVRKQR